MSKPLCEVPAYYHSQELARIFHEASQRLIHNEFQLHHIKTVVIYGAGRTGLKLQQVLTSKKIQTQFFIDEKRGGSALNNTPCFNKKSFPENTLHIPVMIAIHNPQSCSYKIRQELIALGFQHVFLPQDFVSFFPELRHFWLSPSEETLALFSEAQKGLDRLGDDLSKQNYCSILGFRLLGEPPPLPETDQYFPESLPPVSSALRLVDCGAYTGDTLDHLQARGIKLEWCAAFEPDPENYRLLSAKHAGNALLIPCGVSNGMRTAHFKMDGSASSAVSEEEATVTIQMCSLDEILGQTNVNFLKMDIEGGELDALEGAKTLVARDQPRLALASYHHPAHLWEIMQKAIDCGFQGNFFIRVHAFNTFEVVTYGIPLREQAAPFH